MLGIQSKLLSGRNWRKSGIEPAKTWSPFIWGLLSTSVECCKSVLSSTFVTNGQILSQSTKKSWKIWVLKFSERNGRRLLRWRRPWRCRSTARHDWRAGKNCKVGQARFWKKSKIFNSFKISLILWKTYDRWYVKTKNAPIKGGEKVDWFTGQGKI